MKDLGRGKLTRFLAMESSLVGDLTPAFIFPQKGHLSGSSLLEEHYGLLYCLRGKSSILFHHLQQL